MTQPPPKNYLHLPLGERAPDEINVVVEIPEGCKNKYEYDKTYDIFRLDRALHSPIHYPGDYGFAPQTLALDGDPLDVLILVIQPTFPGCLVVARPIGLLEMLDEGKSDDKVVAVQVGEPALFVRPTNDGHTVDLGGRFERALQRSVEKFHGKTSTSSSAGASRRAG